MAILGTLFTRRRTVPRFSALPRRTRQRLTLVCDDLTRAENEMACKLGIRTPPRLMLMDEEEAVLVLANDRKQTAD